MNRNQALVVVVEDDVGMRQALQRLLQAVGYRARAFESAEALLSANGAHQADCLVLDLQLPGASGTELYARLGAGRPPAVFITAQPGARADAAVARAGSGPVLAKPFGASELKAAIGCAMARAAPTQ
jgi:FixJ family two-component response regulator